MKKYNHARARQARILIPPRAPYAPHAPTTRRPTIYIVEWARTRDTHASNYARMFNAVHTVIKPHTQTHLPRAPITRAITPSTPYQPPDTLNASYTYHYTDTRTVKACVYSHDKLIWYGQIRRTLAIHGDTVTITLHRGTRDFHVKPYIPDTTNGYTFTDLTAHQVECYTL